MGEIVDLVITVEAVGEGALGELLSGVQVVSAAAAPGARARTLVVTLHVDSLAALFRTVAVWVERRPGAVISIGLGASSGPAGPGIRLSSGATQWVAHATSEELADRLLDGVSRGVGVGPDLPPGYWIICKKCGHRNSAGDDFCGSCGAFLEWSGARVPVFGERSHRPRGGPQPTFSARLDQALAAVTPGRFAFDPPVSMRQGRSERVTVALVRSQDLDAELLSFLRESRAPQLADVRTSPLMSVRLGGDRAFAITPLSELEQPVSAIAVTTWEFDVRALRPGRHVLTTIVALRLPMDGHDDVRCSLPVLGRSVQVQVAPAYAAGRFVSANWQWIAGTLIALGGGLAAWKTLLH